jgi:hypothetical protein
MADNFLWIVSVIIIAGIVLLLMTDGVAAAPSQSLAEKRLRMAMLPDNKLPVQRPQATNLQLIEQPAYPAQVR